jgi:hypothetical protein
LKRRAADDSGLGGAADHGAAPVRRGIEIAVSRAPVGRGRVSSCRPGRINNARKTQESQVSERKALQHPFCPGFPWRFEFENGWRLIVRLNIYGNLLRSIEQSVNHEFSTFIVAGRGGKEAAPEKLQPDFGMSLRASVPDGGPGTSADKIQTGAHP